MSEDFLTENIKTARELVEQALNGRIDDQFGKEAYYMFSLSKYLLIKETIVKKDERMIEKSIIDDGGNEVKKSIRYSTLYFDNDKYKNYIPLLLDFYGRVNASSNVMINNINADIKLKNESMRTDKLVKSIWFFSQIRNAIAHGAYEFRSKKDSADCIYVENIAEDGSFHLQCEIPIYLFNLFTFFVDNKIEETGIEDIDERFKDYNKNIKLDVVNNCNYELVELKNESFHRGKEDYSRKTKLLLSEIKVLLELGEELKKNTISNTAVIFLYNYMLLLFSKLQLDTIDYSKLKLSSYDINYSGNSLSNYEDQVQKILLYLEFYSENIDNLLIKYDDIINDQNINNEVKENARIPLMYKLLRFYNGIFENIDSRNKSVVSSMRNAVEHANFRYDNKRYDDKKTQTIVMYDQSNQSDDETIKFLVDAPPKQLFEMMKTLENGKNKELTIGDIKDELFSMCNAIGYDEIIKKLWNKLEILSKNAFGQDLDLSMTIDDLKVVIDNCKCSIKQQKQGKMR